LGAFDWAGKWLTGVELTFRISGNAVANQYKRLRAYQWSGPEAVWLKGGSGSWNSYRSSPGSGEDSPSPENQKTTTTEVTYYDCPGIETKLFAELDKQGAQRIHLIQNFTGWVIGDSPTSKDERLCEVAAWHAVVSLSKDANKWSRDTSRSEAGM